MADFLLELRCEEIPARMQPKAKEDLARLFTEALAKAGLTAESVESFATPRRLALIAKGLPLATMAVSEETKGPKVGAPPQALEGFLRKVGLAAEQLVERDGVYFAVVDKPGRDTTEVLAEAIPAIIRAFPWPKSMRWGAGSITTESLRWVRPLSGIIALLDGEVVPFAVDGIASGRTTMGHRFHHSGPVEIADAGAYIETLRAAHVIVHFSERCRLIREGAEKIAAEAGLRLVADEGLVTENAGLTEWPVPLLGRFDEAFLEVPPEVIQLTARVNQKYFVCEDAQSRLANAFICTANIAARDPAVVVDGNRKVLAARLSDARFFWEQDQKTSLADHAKKLSRITFHEKLGTVADKVERVAKLARWLCEEGIVAADPALAEQAARLCKADLVTEMVGEFPELQGLMGGCYAAKEGLLQDVAEAIRDHYKPVGQGDEVPTAPVTVAVSLADKLDTLGCFFGIDEKPTSSKDPFALRRAALGVIRLILANGLRADLAAVLRQSIPIVAPGTFAIFERVANSQISQDALVGELLNFFADRLKVQQREAGVRHDLIDAVFALGGEDDLVRLLARVHALQAFISTEDGANLLAGYKRAANILKKEGWESPESAALTYTPEPAEAALIAALDAAAPRAAEAVAAEDFAAAMAALATLRGPIDRFFDDVTVNAEDANKRAARLALLARFRDAVHRVADFSRIEG
ncbi:MAG: glycine--tRNA ligase subunit beta [Erythrobacter sp.]